MGGSQLQILKPTDSNGRNSLISSSGRAPGISGKLAVPLTPSAPSGGSGNVGNNNSSSNAGIIAGGKMSDSAGRDSESGGLRDDDNSLVEKSPGVTARDRMPGRDRKKPVVEKSREDGGMGAGGDLDEDREALLLAVELNAKA